MIYSFMDVPYPLSRPYPPSPIPSIPMCTMPFVWIPLRARRALRSNCNVCAQTAMGRLAIGRRGDKTKEAVGGWQEAARGSTQQTPLVEASGHRSVGRVRPLCVVSSSCIIEMSFYFAGTIRFRNLTAGVKMPSEEADQIRREDSEQRQSPENGRKRRTDYRQRNPAANCEGCAKNQRTGDNTRERERERSDPS
jgi:hypothetical protein